MQEGVPGQPGRLLCQACPGPSLLQVLFPLVDAAARCSGDSGVGNAAHVSVEGWTRITPRFQPSRVSWVLPPASTGSSRCLPSPSLETPQGR